MSYPGSLRGVMAKIDSQLVQIYQAATSAASDQGEMISGKEAEKLIRRAEELNKISAFDPKGPRGTKHLGRLFSRNLASFSADGRLAIETYLSGRSISSAAESERVGEVALHAPLLEDLVVLDFQAQKKTWPCHWFPMQETRAGGDPINNLYAENGPLDKLDRVTGGKARAFEIKTFRKAVDAGKEFGWWGHCNNAAEAACLLQAPKHGVVVEGADGSQVKFSPIDIQGLLVKVTPSLIERVDFRGQRFNNPKRDDPSEPRPEVFMAVMNEWALAGLPFVLDIERNAEVWNFPYDQVKITQLKDPPEGFDSADLPLDGSVKYYQIEMAGTGFDEKKRTYQCYIHYQGTEVIDSAWIKTPNSNYNPDFMWRPHPIGDLLDRATWMIKGPINNPGVDPKIVYDIYIKSLL